MGGLLLLAGTLYAIFLTALAWLGREPQRRFALVARASGRPAPPEVVVVVAARDEADHLPRLLAALDAQDHSAGRLTCVIVDDGSTDATPRILDTFQGSRHTFQFLRPDHDPALGSPKKAALAAGIGTVQAPYILLTDADTIPPPGWVRGMSAALAGGCPVVAGHSPTRPARGVLGTVAALWHMGSASLSAGFIGLGIPLHVSGRNWGFTRDLYDSASGWQGLQGALSGDDTLLLQRFAAYSDPATWGYTFDPDLLVPTPPPAGWRAFLRQEQRHVATGRRFRLRPLAAALLAALLFGVMWFGLVTLPLKPAWSASALTALLLKVTADTLVLGAAAVRTREYLPLLWAPLFSTLHLLVFPLLQLAGLLLPVRWKGRTG